MHAVKDATFTYWRYVLRAMCNISNGKGGFKKTVRRGERVRKYFYENGYTYYHRTISFLNVTYILAYTYMYISSFVHYKSYTNKHIHTQLGILYFWLYYTASDDTQKAGMIFRHHSTAVHKVGENTQDLRWNFFSGFYTYFVYYMRPPLCMKTNRTHNADFIHLGTKKYTRGCVWSKTGGCERNLPRGLGGWFNIIAIRFRGEKVDLDATRVTFSLSFSRLRGGEIGEGKILAVYSLGHDIAVKAFLHFPNEGTISCGIKLNKAWLPVGSDAYHRIKADK